MNTDFHGIFPYLVSPVNPDGSIREESLRRLTEHLIACGVHGLTPLGSTGEFFYLSWEQKREIVRIVLDQAAGRVPVVAGVGCSSVRESAAQAAELERMGVDGILSILNVYFPLSQQSVYQYFAETARAVSCQVVLYNNPKFTGFEIPVDTLARLSQLPNINYYKDASANTGKLLELSTQVGDQLRIFSASAHVPVFVMMLGGVGWMAGPACLIPRQSVRLYELCAARQWEEAMALQRRLWGLNAAFQRYGLAACIKTGLNLQGFDVGGPVPPLAPLDQEGERHVRAVLEELGALDPQ